MIQALRALEVMSEIPKSMHMIKAFLVDLDGTLIDATEGHVIAYNEALQSLGYKKIELKQYMKYYGQTGMEIMRQLIGKKEIDKDVKELFELKKKIYRSTNGAYVKILPGAAELIDAIYERKIPIVVASSGSRWYVESSIKIMGIQNKVVSIISADDITHGKPDPEIFLKAAEKAGVLPRDCFVLEDSIHGIRAAKSAGMKCAAVIGTEKKSILKKENPDIIVNSLEELLPPRLDEIISEIFQLSLSLISLSIFSLRPEIFL